MTAFERNREGGNRTHAAVDLYAPAGTPVIAVADGKVVRIAPVFTGAIDENQAHDDIPATGAIEVQHPGLGIIRYGEVAPGEYRQALFIFAGSYVRQGTVIGFVGSQGNNYGPEKKLMPRPTMLHLEWYADWLSSDTSIPGNALTQEGNLKYDKLTETQKQGHYNRRHDLVDPTERIRRAPLARYVCLGSSFVTEESMRVELPAGQKTPPSLSELLRQAPIVWRPALLPAAR